MLLLLLASLFTTQQTRVLSFDVASVKTSTFGQSGLEGSKRSRVDVTPKSVTLRNVTVGDCIQWAYNVKPYQIAGASLGDERYDIRAVVDSEVSTSQLRAMMQDLLAKRFQMALHRETKPMPVLELVIAKGGPKLPPPKPGAVTHSAESLPRVENGGFVFADTTMAEFATQLGMLRTVDMPVVDRTGIAGVFDIRLKDAAEANRRDDGPPISTFLEEQLGLKLVSAKSPMEVLVVDRVGKPTGN